jgi:hypothetical protein
VEFRVLWCIHKKSSALFVGAAQEDAIAMLALMHWRHPYTFILPNATNFLAGCPSTAASRAAGNSGSCVRGEDID